MREALAAASRWVATPILVKELRATFRGWRFFAAHALLLSLFALILLITLVVWLTESDPNPSAIGRMVFVMFIVFQGILVALVMPAFGCTSVVGERERKSFDLLLTTTLSPAGIVWGKFTATMAYSLLFLVSTLPLVSLAFLFGGVSLAELGAAYAYLLVSSVLLNLYAVFISTTVKTSQRAVVACYLFLGAVVAFLILWAAWLEADYLERTFEGRSAELSVEFEDASELIEKLLFPGFCYLGLLFVFFLSASNRLKPPTANHSTPFRVYYAVLAAGGATMALWDLQIGSHGLAFGERLDFSLIILCLLGGLSVFSQVFAAEEAVLPLRLRTELARMRGVRRFLRPLMPGSVNGAVYCVVVNGLLFAACVLPLFLGVLGPESYGKVELATRDPGPVRFVLSATETSRAALAVPLVAACLWSFLVMLSGAGVLLSTLCRQTTTAKGLLGLVVMGVVLVPLVGWLVVVLGRDPDAPRPWWMAAANLPLAITSAWDGLRGHGAYPCSFAFAGREGPYAGAFCGAHIVVGAGLFAWGLARRRRLLRLADRGPVAGGTS